MTTPVGTDGKSVQVVNRPPWGKRSKDDIATDGQQTGNRDGRTDGRQTDSAQGQTGQKRAFSKK